MMRPMSTLTALPRAIRAGTTVEFDLDPTILPDYPASAYTLKAILAGRSVLSVTAGKTGDTHNVAFTAAETAPLLAGRYQWLFRVTEDATGKKYDVDGGFVEILLNLETAAPGDAQSANEKLLADLDAILLKRAANDLRAVQVHGRMTQFNSFEELARFRNRVYAAVLRERRGGRHQVDVVRFGNP